MLGALLALPNWGKAAIAGIVIAGALLGAHWWQVRGLKKEIAKVEQERDRALAANAELRTAVADVSANRDALQRRILEQNHATDLLQATAKQADTSAALATTRVNAAGLKQSAALRQPVTSSTPAPARISPGAAAMNAWMHMEFAR